MSFNQRSHEIDFQSLFTGFDGVLINICSKLNQKNNVPLELLPDQGKMNDERIIKTEDGAIVRKVFVTNIDKQVGKKKLQKLFESFGQVHDVFIKTSDSSVGTRINVTFGFVTFLDPESAYDAIKSEKPIILKHRRLKVRPADTWHQPILLDNGELNYDMGVNAIESSLPLRKEIYNEKFENATTSHKLPPNNDVLVTSINILNDDCLVQIFSYFTLFELINLEEVCARWHNVIDMLWQRIHHICTDDLKSCKLTTDALRRILVRCGKYLKSLKISSDKHSFNSRIHQVISKSCPHLETLHLSGVSSNATGVMALSRGCKELQTLVLQDITGVQDHVLETLFRQNPNLVCVHIEGNSAMTGRCLRSLSSDILELALIKCNSLQLKELRVAFKNMKKLQSLTFDSCMTLTSNFLVDVADCFPNLEKFSLNKYYPLMHNNSLRPIVRMTNLTTLSFNMNTLVSNNLLEELSQKCINLESLDLSSCYRNDRYLTIEGLNYLAKFPKLNKLHLNYMEIVSEESLSLLSLKGNLVLLELRGCLNLSDVAVIKIIEKCTKLEYLDISGCDNITTEILTFAFNVKSKSNNEKLEIIIGGTGIFHEEAAMEHNAHPNLKINFDNLCEPYLRPDFFDNYFPDSDDDLEMLDIDYDDDDFDDFHYFAAGVEVLPDFLSDDEYY